MLTSRASKLRSRLPRLSALAADRRGVTSLLFGVMATAVLGIVGLATQAGLWYADYASLQTVADAAATAGAVGIAGGETATQFKASAAYVLKQNGYVNGQNGVSATVNSPPASGPNSSNNSAVEVLLSAPESLTFARLFLSVAPTLKVRSVAQYGSNNPTCVLAIGQNLGGSNDGQFSMSGGASFHASGCTLATNNTGADAFYLAPSPSVTAYTVVSSGGVASSCGQGPTGCGNTLNLTRPYSQDHVATADPLASVQSVALPPASQFTSSSCTTLSYPNYNSANTLAAGTTYCGANLTSENTMTFPSSGGTYTFTGNVDIGAGGGNPTVSASGASPVTVYINGNLAIANNAQVNLPPGTYFIDGGNLSVGNSATLSCSSCAAGGAGITFVLMGGTVQISGSSPVTFDAPASNNYNSGLDGVAIYEPVSDTGTNTLSGSGTLTVQGAFYAPGAVLDISGGAGSSSETCSVLIANTITMTGSGYATDTDCSSYGYGWTTSGPTPNGVTLVE